MPVNGNYHGYPFVVINDIYFIQYTAYVRLDTNLQWPIWATVAKWCIPQSLFMVYWDYPMLASG